MMVSGSLDGASQMRGGAGPSKRTILGLGLAVSVAGAFCGAAAGLGYGIFGYALYERPGLRPPPLIAVGTALGAASAVLVYVCWCWGLMTLRGRLSAGRLMGLGVGLGIMAGVVATLILHAGLVLQLTLDLNRPGRSAFDEDLFGAGLMCGTVVGATMGAVGAWLFRSDRGDQSIHPDSPQCCNPGESTP